VDRRRELRLDVVLRITLRERVERGERARLLGLVELTEHRTADRGSDFGRDLRARVALLVRKERVDRADLLRVAELGARQERIADVAFEAVAMIHVEAVRLGVVRLRSHAHTFSCRCRSCAAPTRKAR